MKTKPEAISKVEALDIARTCLSSTQHGQRDVVKIAAELRASSVTDPEAFDRVYRTRTQAPNTLTPG